MPSEQRETGHLLPPISLVGVRCGNGLFPLINLPTFILASLS